MYGFLIKTLIAVMVVLTLFVSVKKPVAHKKIQIYDSSYVMLVEENKKQEEKTVREEEIPQMQNEAIKKKAKTFENKQIKAPEIKKNVQTKKAENNIQINPEIVKTQSLKSVQKKENTAKTQAQLEREEIIAWNKWHSDIQNKLMQEVKMPLLPDGIVFKFSFTVDKYGKITNINTYSVDSKFTPYAVEYIAPVIRSFQGKSILNFPNESKRTVTEFKGGWKMSSHTKYSNPSDYNDIEKVRN